MAAVTPGVHLLFRIGIRARDQKCVIPDGGALLAASGVWAKLEAAHVFPPGYENWWNEYGYFEVVDEHE